MQTFPSNIDVFITGDGSPTLVFKRADGYAEKMHHSRGALTESFYIYEEALQLALTGEEPVHILSMGLGLGYNELISIATLLKQNRGFKIWSFEAEPYLREGFRQWLNQTSPVTALDQVLEKVVTMIAEKTDLPSLKADVKRVFEEGQLDLRGAFPIDAAGAGPYNLVYYDAYSNKMDPELWQEQMLTEKLGKNLADRCVFATYAATGALKRSLKQLGFSLIRKKGFSGRRESTLAIRKHLS